MFHEGLPYTEFWGVKIYRHWDGYVIVSGRGDKKKRLHIY